jgi:cell division protein FtsL
MPLPRHPSARRPAGLVIVTAALLIALLCAIASVRGRDFQTAGALTRVMVDLDRSGITDRRAEWAYFNRVNTRADLVAHLMATGPALEFIGRRARVPPDEIAAVAPVVIEVAGPLTEPGSESRAREIALAKRHYRLEIHSRPGSPIVDIYAQAPSVAQAERLANASIAGARDYFQAVATRTGPLDRARMGDAPNTPVRLFQLGRPHGAVLTVGAGLKVAALTFLVAFAVAYAALRGLLALRRRPARGAKVGPALEPSGGAMAPVSRAAAVAAAPPPVAALRWSAPVPGPGGALALRTVRAAPRPRAFASGDGNWPRTTRALPWMLAAFMAMIWLVPFDSLDLKVSAPIDLELDRIVLPFIFGTWALSVAIGGPNAPRLRPTWIHASVGAFVVIACLSVILDAPSLNQSLELDVSLKKVPLLLSYLSVFLMMASVIRRDEVAAFLKYTLVLAVICALGMVWEEQQLRNLFFEWSQNALGSAFEVATSSSGWDTEGRRLVHGPAAHPLVAAAMLSLVVPIALLGVIHAPRLRGRLLYGLAGCLLMLGMLSTQRKTGLVAPVAGILTLAYFRRRELLRLAPVAVVLLIALVIVAPGTVAPVIDQFKPERLTGANTVSDRASDYDAIRPDFGTHVALGRGYGSYQPVGHRILDSELLVRIVEMGAFGAVALFLLGASVVACARRTIHSRHPAWAPSALAGAAAGVVFIVLALLFDSLAYPQLPYIFLSFAAFVAVIVKSPDDADSLDPA